jgi:hypothetical protein
MVHLNLNYFNTIRGPQIFHTVPEDIDKNIAQSVANLLNISELVKQKFFLYEAADFKTVSLYLEVPSEWARGKKEMLLLSIILPPDFTIENKDPVHALLEKVASEISQVENGFMAFYEYDSTKLEDFGDEIEDIALTIRQFIEKFAKEANMSIKEAKKTKEVYEAKKVGFYVIDEDVLNYLYELEQSKIPFVRFGDFIDSGISVFTTALCIQELPLDEPMKGIIRDFIGYRETDQKDIEALKEGVDPRRLPSDAKLSLIVLIKYLKEVNPDYDLTVVSPDHKYLRFIQDFFPNLRGLPPSSFLLEIINNLEVKDSRDYFESLRKRLMNYELQKAMAEEEGAGESSEHLTWLIEKALSVASQPIIPIGKGEEKLDADLELKEISLINKFIAGEPIEESEFALIQEYEAFLNGIIQAQEALKIIQEEIAKDELMSAQTKIFATIKKLNDLFLLASASLQKQRKNRMQILLANFIANFEFLAALSHLNLMQLDQSIERFSSTSTFSAIAEQGKKVLISSYLKSITCLYNDAYQDAIQNFTITSDLGAKYNFPGYQIMCLAGKAISELLFGKADMANITITEVTQLIPTNEKEALVMFHEFGDNFYMKGKPEIAIHLYNEALELAIFLDEKQSSSDIYNKLERSFYAVGAYNTPLSAEIHNLITKAHTLKDMVTIEKYNMQIAQLGDINKLLFFETFPYITEDWISGEDLQKILLNPFDLLNLVVVSDTKKRGTRRIKALYTDLYCYRKELGGVIIRVPEAIELKVKQIPVIYTVTLNPKNSKFKIIDTTKEEKQFYYARAIIQTQSKNYIIIKRVYPEIFGKFFAD